MEKASSLNPTDLDNLNNLGTAYLLLRRADKAERAFKAVLVQDDSYAAAYNGLGLVAVQRGDTDVARSNFEKALQLNPELVEPLLHLGLLYQGLGRKDEALHYLSLFLEKAPSREFAHLTPSGAPGHSGFEPQQLGLCYPLAYQDQPPANCPIGQGTFSFFLWLFVSGWRASQGLLFSRSLHPYNLRPENSEVPQFRLRQGLRHCCGKERPPKP